MTTRRSFLLAVPLLLTVSSAAFAWPGTKVHPGVTYEHRSGLQDYGSGDYAQEIYITYVDTTNPAVSFVASRPEDQKMTPSKFAAKVGASVAINANFFNTSNFASCGMAMGQSKLWTDVYQSGNSCADSVVFGPDAHVSFVNTAGKAKGPAPAGARDVITGMPTLVHQGTVVDQAVLESSDYPSHMKSANPRTAVCLHDDKHTMILAVVDGREPGKRVGMRAITLARFMKSLGCYEAVNLDGGGSSEMYVKGQTAYPGRPAGVVNRTSDGHERTVCCSLGVVIDENPPKPDAGADTGTGEDAGTAGAAGAGQDASVDAGGGAGGLGGGAGAAGAGAAGGAGGYAAGGEGGDAGQGTVWGGTEDEPEDASGCACSAARSSEGASGWLWMLAGALAVLLRRKERLV